MFQVFKTDFLKARKGYSIKYFILTQLNISFIYHLYELIDNLYYLYELIDYLYELFFLLTEQYISFYLSFIFYNIYIISIHMN